MYNYSRFRKLNPGKGIETEPSAANSWLKAVARRATSRLWISSALLSYSCSALCYL